MKKFKMLLLVLGCILFCTACGNNNAPEGTEGTESAGGAVYTVTLDPNGGAFSDGKTEAITISVKEGKAINFADYMPEMEGEALYGWYYLDGSPWPGARKVTEDVSLKAKWGKEEVVVEHKLELINEDAPVALEYDNGVYQFTIVSQIYGGYAQRSGKYTVYEDQLLAAMQADDGTKQRMIYRANSNYVDATGTIYAEFYNDGEFSLFYDYEYKGKPNKYHMGTGYWTYEGYTAPFEHTPLEKDEDGMGAPSGHIDWEVLVVEGQESESEDTQAEEKEFVTIPGTQILEVSADVSETMKLHFYGNGVMTIYMTKYGVDVDKAYLWKYSKENGLTLTYKGSEESGLTDNGDGTYTLADNFSNTYTIKLSDLVEKITEPKEILVANATVSKTMTAHFFDDNSVEIFYDLSGQGAEGFFTVSRGQWGFAEDGSLQIAFDGVLMELVDNNGTTEFTLSDNTYAFDAQKLSD